MARAQAIDSLVASWSKAAVVPARGTPKQSLRRVRNSVYEAGASTRRTLGWNAPTTSPNNAILHSLTTLRDRSRAATRNNGYAKGVIEKLVSNIIGTGIKPLSQADDAEFRKAIQALWLKWTDESDADGLLDYYGQIAQACWAWLEGGEAFIRIRSRRAEDGLSVPLQLQVLEPELCPHTNTTIARNGNRVRAGIEFNAIGKRVAYWFHPSTPGHFEDFDAGQFRRVPADSVIHLYNPIRPGQIRGLPHLTQALILLNEADKLNDATLLRQQIANLFTAFLTRPASIGEAEALHPLTGLPIEKVGEDQVLSLEPAIFQELQPGEEVQFSEPPDVSPTYADFMRHQLFGVAAATGVPYETLTGDMSKVNDRTVRVILHEFRRRIQQYQHQIIAFQVSRKIWRAWMDRVFLAGPIEIPAAYIEDPEPWIRVKWMPQGWPYLHPVQDVEAETKATRSGFTSRSAAVSERGEDAEEIDREQANDNERADELGLKYDSDGRNGPASESTAQPDEVVQP